MAIRQICFQTLTGIQMPDGTFRTPAWTTKLFKNRAWLCYSRTVWESKALFFSFGSFAFSLYLLPKLSISVCKHLAYLPQMQIYENYVTWQWSLTKGTDTKVLHRCHNMPLTIFLKSRNIFQLFFIWFLCLLHHGFFYNTL